MNKMTLRCIDELSILLTLLDKKQLIFKIKTVPHSVTNRLEYIVTWRKKSKTLTKHK